ncbi:MAG: hypothetical protein LN417_05815 [Candidatus Thermoplasmatota archaeon]|nr:hypothetical protein [Candidatus Thermoplasmatota archaeon]
MKRLIWKREIAVFLLISLAIWAVLFAFFLGLFLIAEYRLHSDWTASQILKEKWGFSLILSILFSLQAWAIGVHDVIENYLERKNVLRVLGLVEE